MASTLRELAIRVTADSSSYQREMSRASRLGTDYYKTMEDRSRRFDSYIANNNRSIQAMHMQLTQLKASALSVAAVFAGGFAFTTVVGMADDWGQMAARIKMAITSVEGSADSYSKVQDRLLELSNRNAKSISDSQELYVSTASSMRDLGYSTNDTLDFIEAMSNSYTINATSAEKVKTNIDALTKSMVTGKVGSDQWKQLMTSTPNVVTELANATGKAESVIKNMGLNGEISMRMLADAMIKAKDRTSELADGMGNTVKDGFTQISNSFQYLIGELNSNTGATQGIASGLRVVADNIDLIAGAGATLIAVGMGRYFGELSTSIIRATQTTLANRTAQITNSQAQLAAVKALQAKAVSEVNAARFEAQRAVGLKANLIAQNNLTAAIKQQTLANNQLATAQARVNALTSKVGLLSRAGSGLLGLMGGPIGLAATLLTVGAGFLMMGDSADKAKKPLEELQLPLDELIKKYKELNQGRQQAITSQIDAEIKVNVKDVDKDITVLKDKLKESFKEDVLTLDRAFRFLSPEKGKAVDEAIDKITVLKKSLQDGVIVPNEFEQGIYKVGQGLKTAVKGGEEFDLLWGGLISDLLNSSKQLGDNKEKLDAVNQASIDAASGANELKDALTFPNLDNQLGTLNQQLAIAEIKTKSGGEAAYVLAGLQRAAGDEALNHASALYALALGQDDVKLSTDELTAKVKAYADVLRKTYKLNGDYKESNKGHGKSSVDVYKSQLDRLNSQINAFTDLTELQKIKRQLSDGDLSKLSDIQKKTLELKAIEIDRLNGQKEYKSLLDSLKSPAEKQLDTYKEHLAVIEKANLSLKERQELLDKMAKKSIESAPTFSFQDSYNGIGSDLINVAEEEKKLRDWNDLQLKIQNDLLEQKIISQQEYADTIVQIEQTMQQKQKDLQSAYTLASLGTFSTLTGSIADMFKETAGESSAAYKVMFLASKAASIAQAIVSTEVAAAKALELGPIMGIPAASMIRGLGYASVGMIAAQTISGMAHSGIDNIPKEGTWLLDKGERVVDARTNADLKDFLQTSNKSSNSISITVPVSLGSNTTEEDGKQLGNLIKQTVTAVIQEQQRAGGLLNKR